jgi:hypothetical protein
MAVKRRIENNEKNPREKPVYNESEDLPEKYQDMDWRTWLTKVYAKVWFVFICIWLEAMVWLTVRNDLGQPWELATLLAAVMILPEYLIYKRFWSKGARKKPNKM